MYQLTGVCIHICHVSPVLTWPTLVQRCCILHDRYDAIDGRANVRKQRRRGQEEERERQKETETKRERERREREYDRERKNES